MSEISADEHEKNVSIIKKMKRNSWILIAIAFALTVFAIIALAVGMKYIPEVYHESIGDDGIREMIYDGYRYKELDSIIACMIAAVIGNFLLFLYFQIPHIWVDKNTGVTPFIGKIVKTVLRIIGTLLIVAMAVVTAGVYIGVDAYKTADAWILGAYGMCSIGEVITLVVYYWNTRFLRGPAGSDLDYLYKHHKLFKRSQRANGFTKFYIAVPYVAYAIGYFISVLLGSFANKLGKLMCGGIHLIIIAAAVVLSVAWFFKKYRLSKSAIRDFNKSKSTSDTRSQHNDSIDSSDYSEKPVDKSYADGKRRLADGLYEHNGLKFVPNSYELSHHVSEVRLSVNLFNKDYFGSSGKLVLHGNVQCKIMREASYPNDVAQEVLDKIIDNIKSRANELLDELADKYSNYNKKFTIDCSGIKISYKIV